ncbi:MULTISPECIES: hypothetical protein [Dehalobacter]|jgi:hypothetical protein|uniref:hypothetical protein n=1 Tax=Dehalobacter TaxID=56112 RepID=UPI00054D0DF3|nr:MULTISPECIES: hypothetical protein [unclassified Dehalobacter]MDJ0306722.1 hypothetical protein [Dehalobacter sp.]
MENNILRQIFFDKERHWDRFAEKYEDRIRAIVVKEVEKFRNCGNPKNVTRSSFSSSRSAISSGGKNVGAFADIR